MNFIFLYPNREIGTSVDDFIYFYKNVYYWRNKYYDEQCIFKLLNKNEELSDGDIKTVLSWKMGRSDIAVSNVNVDEIKTMVNDYKSQPNVRTYNLKTYINFIKDIKEDNGNNIGMTYGTTLLYFASNGTYPIYDRFAAKALDVLNGYVKYSDYSLSSFKQYDNYVNIITEMFKDEYDNRFYDMEKWRAVDQALWAYGHCEFVRDANNVR